MSADIVEYVDQKVRDSASSSTEWSILYADDWAKLRAEIVRLRGEVCSCPSGDGSLRWPCKAHPPGAIAPAEAKDPAPAMPDGVEGLVAEWEALIAHPDTSTIMRTTLENVVTRLRAADNRDAAGVSDDDFVHPEYIRGFNDGAKHTPAAGPAGEAVAVADDFRGWYCAQCQRGVDGREVTFGEQHEVCGRYITDDRPPTHQPADGGAVADSLRHEAWARFHREWAVPGMPKDKQRLAEAAFICGASIASNPTGDALGAVRPVSREVARIGDMHRTDAMRVGLDGDGDAYLSTTCEPGDGVEFCTAGSGGGKSPRTHEALIALMVAIEADNAADPARDWWARRNGVQHRGDSRGREG